MPGGSLGLTGLVRLDDIAYRWAWVVAEPLTGENGFRIVG